MTIRLGDVRYSVQWHPSDWRRWGLFDVLDLPGWACKVLAFGPIQFRRWWEVAHG